MPKHPRDPLKRQIIAFDQRYLAWLRTQDSAAGGGQDTDRDTGLSQCEACHRRRAGISGTGYKGLFTAIPLRHHQHHLQTTKGESKVGGKLWWDEQAAEYLRRWLATISREDAALVIDYLRQQGREENAPHGA